ncbi:MAG: glycosyltransferase family 2 protein [Casimicrobiaceae bacterium]
MPHFSVVIAAFNAARWIVPTVQSALAQTYRSFEIIVVGDGCSDDTGGVLAAQFGASVQWRNLERNSGGQSAPNNEGIRLSRGTHIAYLGHDDIWSPRHLQQLASAIGACDPDFAVSGAVFHGPPGSCYYQTTGIFDDPRVAETEFFPPSSLTHRRDVVDRIGLWRDPNELRAPADCEFLLRAVEHRCTFASTRTITAHKFAAGHRYLSYRFPSDAEQRQLLERLGEKDGESRILEEIQSAVANGAEHPAIRYFDFGRFGAGELFRRNRGNKGLEKPPPVAIDGPHWLPVESFPAGLDWYDVEERSLVGPFRWSGPNPNARYLVNVRLRGAARLRIHVVAFAADDLAASLKVDIDQRDAAFVCDRTPTGGYVLALAPVVGPVDDGLVLRFRLPRCVRLPSDPGHGRVGLALRGIEVVPVS